MMENANSREKILEEAERLFFACGYDGVGVSEIARAAGITKPTLYYFFQSKEGLLQTIVEERNTILINNLSSSAKYIPCQDHYDADVHPVLCKVVRTYFSFAQKYPTFYLFLLAQSFAPPTAKSTKVVLPFLEKQYQIVTDLFIAISRAHGRTDGQEYVRAMSFISMINAVVALWYHGHGSLDDGAMQTLVHRYMHGIFA